MLISAAFLISIHILKAFTERFAHVSFRAECIEHIVHENTLKIELLSFLTVHFYL